MKNNWPIKKLGDVADIISGQSPSGSSYNKSGDGLPLYQGKRDFGSMFTADPATWTTETTKIAKPHDILISVRAPVGPVNISNHRINIGRGLAAIRPWEDLDYLFLFYFLRSQEKNITQLGSGSTFQSITKKDLDEIRIPVPSIKIQQKIVERLDAIRKAQELNDLQISKTQELFESIIQNEIINGHWPENELKKAVKKQSTINPKATPEKEYHYIDISSIDKKTKQILIFNKFLGKNAPSRARKIVKNGDTVFSTVRPYLKSIAHVINLPDPKVASTGFCVLSPNELVDHNWLYYNVLSDWFIDKVLPFQKGAAYPAVSDQDILNQTIKFPPLSGQQKIVEKLNAVQNYKKSLLHQKSLLQELFDSVLDKSMNGKI